jgi:YHS domain-containing protein
MEKEVLFTPQALKLLEAGFVAVKVDLPKNPKLQARFGIDSMPTDLILAPDGKVLAKTEGYEEIARAGDRDRKRYLANLSRINSQYAASGKRHESSDVAAGNKNGNGKGDSQTPVKKDRVLASAAPSTSSTKDKLVPPPNKIDPPVGSQAIQSPAAAEVNDVPEVIEPEEISEEVQIAMDGYCPVTLRTTRSWKTGNKDISLEYEGQIYYFTSADKRDEFRSHPGRYAPRLLGCDPVTLADNDVAIRGSTQYGAFYDGALFLFESADSRAKFRKTPTRYSQLKHVLKPEDVKNVASNVDP